MVHNFHQLLNYNKFAARKIIYQNEYGVKYLYKNSNMNKNEIFFSSLNVRFTINIKLFL